MTFTHLVNKSLGAILVPMNVSVNYPAAELLSAVYSGCGYSLECSCDRRLPSLPVAGPSTPGGLSVIGRVLLHSILPRARDHIQGS
jgi:hypothetical protein